MLTKLYKPYDFKEVLNLMYPELKYIFPLIFLETFLKKSQLNLRKSSLKASPKFNSQLLTKLTVRSVAALGSKIGSPDCVSQTLYINTHANAVRHSTLVRLNSSLDCVSVNTRISPLALGLNLSLTLIQTFSTIVKNANARSTQIISLWLIPIVQAMAF